MDTLCTYEGDVHSIIFQNADNGYTVLRLLTDEAEVVTLVGCIPCVAPGEHLIANGTMETHPQHGEQMKVVELERRLPEEEDEIYAYLASGVCKGLGPATARRIVDRFGVESLDVIEREPEKLRLLKGFTPKKAQDISKAFCLQMGLRRLMAFLATYQLSPLLAMELRRRYGDNALAVVQANPYLLSMEDLGVAFASADEMAMAMGMEEDSAHRMEAAVLFELRHNEQNGHSFLPKDKLLQATCQLLNCDLLPVEQALERLIAQGSIRCEQVANVEGCYLRRLWEAEVTACARMLALAQSDAYKSPHAERALEKIEAEQGLTYAPLQREAVRLAAQKGVVVLTGGPGTGKTTSVRGIVALFQSMGLDMLLCAPTGRAAKRMSELTGMEAQTIHRMLGMNWNEALRQTTFTKNEQEPLEAHAVIVDEVSMVDLTLFSALLRALRPGTRLVLVGDHDQLPSVGAGNVLSDLIRSGKIDTVVLREVFRQAEQSAIIRNAHQVNLGNPPDFASNQGDYFFLCRRDAQRAVDTVAELCQTRLPDKMGIPMDQIQVLTATRKGPTGTIALNRTLQALLNPPQKEKLEKHWGEQVFRVGDRVMQTKNNYDVIWEKEDGTVGTGMFNGDIGKIIDMDTGGEWVELQFDDRTAVYTADLLSHLDLAYAQTVHKAQGSEYRAVVLVAMPAAQSLLVRGVLYTALTRARELLVVVGDDVVLRAMAANERRQRRYSGLRWRLAHGEDETT
ncbi:ATP-dependent RecD-like DNA helicase [Bengtsoniella intestinalis]|uniref:SF1B family DNA helicase RecD2 n=1 Tax=Bengtsoniella intestinalis TaxID=3073143 RepID=UPI00391F73F9